MSGGGSSSTTEQPPEGGGASTKPGRYLDPLMTKCKPIVACAGKQTYSSTVVLPSDQK